MAAVPLRRKEANHLCRVSPASVRRATEIGLARYGEFFIFVVSTLIVVQVNSWTLHGAMFFFGDEIGNLGRVYWRPYSTIFNPLPQIVYNDRPIGLLLIRVLYDLFGFDYLKQMAVLLMLHLVNFGLVFLVVRRLFTSFIFALIAATLFGANASTISSVWYLGAIFDVLCTGFLLASLFTYLQGGNWQRFASPILFYFALRSKEFAVVFPVLLVLLEIRTTRRWTHVLPHIVVLAIVVAAYATHVAEYTAQLQPDNPYVVSFAPPTLFATLNRYIAIILYRGGPDPDVTGQWYWLLLAALLAFAAVSRRFWVFFGLVGFVALLLPVLIIPRQVSDFYVYGPSVFLFIAITDALRHFVPPLPAYAVVAVAMPMLVATQYDHTRIDVFRTSRQIMFRDAQPVLSYQLRFGHGAHYYVSGLRPYLNPFSSGPCYLLQIYYRDPDIRCFIEMPTEQLEALYAADTSERYFFDYKDSTLTLRAR